ncbi:MAG: response regulator [Phycisphaerales bacterium]|nr:response regulator [Phycisphaerales bacterium]
MNATPPQTRPTDAKPKLLLLASPDSDVAALAAALGANFEIVRGDPAHAAEVLERENCAAVVAPPASFTGLGDITGQLTATLLNAIGEGVALADRAGETTWSNARFRSFHALIHRRLSSVCVDAMQHFDETLARRQDGDQAMPISPKRYSIAMKQSQRYFECMVTPVLDEAAADPGQVARLAVVVREVTDRERTQAKIDALDKAGRELVHFEPEMIKTMHAGERLRLIEQRIGKYAHDLLNFDHFALRLLDEDSGELKLVASTGMPVEAMGIQLFAEAEGQGISGYVAATGRSYICANTEQDSRYVFGLEHAGSSLTVPLKLYDRVIGIFNVESEEVGAFGEQDRQFAEIFANYLAMSFHILNLLLVERYTTRQDTSGTMQGELSAPLNDLALEAERLREETAGNEEMSAHVERILKDVAAIRRRVKDVAQGPHTLLGVDEAMERSAIDPVLHRRRVLVADNELHIAETIRDILQNRGAHVVLSSDGDGAIKLLEQWRLSHDATEAYDLVVSDINLGDKTGYEVFAAARRTHPNLPVILMTGFGYDPHHSIVRASQEGLQCVLFKPFQAESLVDECRKALGAPPRPKSGRKDQGEAKGA